jgi:hypothetical protein
MDDVSWDNWTPVLEKMLADLKALNAYLRGEIAYADYRKRVIS